MPAHSTGQCMSMLGVIREPKSEALSRGGSGQDKKKTKVPPIMKHNPLYPRAIRGRLLSYCPESRALIDLVLNLIINHFYELKKVDIKLFNLTHAKELH